MISFEFENNKHKYSNKSKIISFIFQIFSFKFLKKLQSSIEASVFFSSFSLCNDYKYIYKLFTIISAVKLKDFF
jgi:hypothetical protein